MPADLTGLTLALGIAVIEALQRFGISGVRLKWPNDIMAHGGKLGGILTESRSDASKIVTVVTGIGLNVDLPDEMHALEKSTIINKIVDLKQCTDNPPSRDKLSIAVIESLFDCMVKFESAGFAPFHDDWKKVDWLSGRQIIVDGPDGRCAGTADGVDDDGALMIQTDHDRRRIINGTITLPSNPGDSA